MPDYTITLYYNDLENAIHYGDSTKETAIRLGNSSALEWIGNQNTQLLKKNSILISLRIIKRK